MTTDVINGVPRELLEGILDVMDKYVAYETPEEDKLRTLLATTQPAADGEREAFDIWFRRVKGLNDAVDTTFISEAFFPFKAFKFGIECGRAAQPQQAVAMTDEVRRLREALARAKDHLSHARHDVEVRANSGNEAARLVLAGIDHWMAREAAHKTGEEE